MTNRLLPYMFLIVLVITACSTLERDVPPVRGVVIERGRALGVDVQALERGRGVYMTHCGSCHTLEPIDRYSAEQWRKILPRMSVEAKLSDAQAADLAAYISAARPQP